MPFRRKNKTEKDQMAPQYPPIGVEPFQQAGPVQVSCACAQQMGDISSVKTFSLHDVSLLPDQLFRSNDVYLQTKDRGFAGMLEPDLIHRSESIARAENNVDIHRPALNFGQPMRESVVSRVTGFSPDDQCRLDVFWAKEEIKILGIPIYLCVLSERVSASHHKIDFIIAKQLHDSPANLASALRFHSLKCALQTTSASMQSTNFQERSPINGR